MKRTILRPTLGLNKSPQCFENRLLSKANSYFAFVLFIMLALSTPAMVWAGEDDYLEQLAAEAENTHTQTKNTKKWDAAKQKQFKKMEKMLANNRPTTYKFYKKLSNEKKEKVFNIHVSKNKLSITSKTIMDLYFSN